MTGLPSTGICDQWTHEWQAHLWKWKTFSCLHTYCIYNIKYKSDIIRNACETVILEVCKYYCGRLKRFVWHTSTLYEVILLPLKLFENQVWFWNLCSFNTLTHLSYIYSVISIICKINLWNKYKPCFALFSSQHASPSIDKHVNLFEHLKSTK